MIREKSLIRIGYWRENPRPGDPFDWIRQFFLADLPRAQDCVDASWSSSSEQPVVLAYLKAGRVHERYMGWSDCRICGCMNGTTDLTDGVFVWPDGLAHYVEAHSLKPDSVFIEHVLRTA